MGRRVAAIRTAADRVANARADPCGIGRRQIARRCRLDPFAWRQRGRETPGKRPRAGLLQARRRTVRAAPDQHAQTAPQHRGSGQRPAPGGAQPAAQRAGHRPGLVPADTQREQRKPAKRQGQDECGHVQRGPEGQRRQSQHQPQRRVAEHAAQAKALLPARAGRMGGREHRRHAGQKRCQHQPRRGPPVTAMQNEARPPGERQHRQRRRAEAKDQHQGVGDRGPGPAKPVMRRGIRWRHARRDRPDRSSTTAPTGRCRRPEGPAPAPPVRAAAALPASPHPAADRAPRHPRSRPLPRKGRPTHRKPMANCKKPLIFASFAGVCRPVLRLP